MSDNIPERRNLIITSIAIILYFIAGGEFDGETFRLAIANIKFEHPIVLKVFAWVMLIWFYYRFQVMHKHKFVHSIYQVIDRQKHNRILQFYLEKVLDGKYNITDGFLIETLKFRSQMLHVSFNNRNQHDDRIPDLNIHNAWHGLLRWVLVANTARTNEGLSSWLVPPVLFWLAIATGLSDWLLADRC